MSVNNNNKQMNERKDNSLISLSEIYGKNSFDRFGDDLSEVLLNYLSFEDKIGLECVSKQFQRHICSNQTELVLNQKLFQGLYNSIDLKALESFLKKCPNITTIDLTPNFVNRKQVFDSILKNCKHLNEMQFSSGFNFFLFSECLTQIGPKLKKIKFCDKSGQSFGSLFGFCPNLKSFESNDVYFHEIFDGKRLFANNLQTFSSLNYFSEDIERMRIFVENNRNSLKSFDLVIKQSMETTDLKQLLSELLKVTQIRCLGISYRFEIDDIFPEFVRQLSKKCSKIRKIEFELKYKHLNQYYDIYNSLKLFKHIREVIISCPLSKIKSKLI